MPENRKCESRVLPSTIYSNCCCLCIIYVLYDTAAVVLLYCCCSVVAYEVNTKIYEITHTPLSAVSARGYARRIRISTALSLTHTLTLTLSPCLCVRLISRRACVQFAYHSSVGCFLYTVFSRANFSTSREEVSNSLTLYNRAAAILILCLFYICFRQLFSPIILCSCL